MEEEIMGKMVGGGQSSSGQRKEYFFALALDLTTDVSWCQA